MDTFSHYWRAWLWPLGLLAGAVALALVVHRILVAIGKRAAGTSTIGTSLLRHAEKPTRWVFPLLAIIIVLPVLPVRSELVLALRRVVGLGVIASIAWAVILAGEVLGDTLYARCCAETGDNVAARRVRTQISVLERIFGIAVMMVAAGFMLMTFPPIRQVGASVLASAGLAGLAVGIAMKPTFSNMIAGLQIALTGSIRIDDVVIVEGEWGWIEEILSTYVVVRTWDLRRLIVPLSYFIDHTFQNWTRQTTDLLTYVILYCDYTVPVEELRQEFRRVLESSPVWDRKVCALQVVDASEHAVHIRALASASDSSKASDLQYEIREKLIRFLQENYPQSLPRTRAELSQGPARALKSDSDGIPAAAAHGNSSRSR